MKKLLSLVLIIQTALVSPAGFAEKVEVTSGEAVSAPNTDIATVPYMLDCEDLLTVSGNGIYERRFIDGATDEQKMLQLLFDYRIILTKIGQNAMELELAKHIPNMRQSESGHLSKDEVGEKIDRLRGAMLAMFKLSEDKETIKAIAWTTIDNLIDLSSAHGTKSEVQRIRHLQLTRFRDEMKISKNREVFERVMSEYVREQILATVDAKFKRFVGFHLGHSSAGNNRANLIAFGGIAAAIIAANYLMFDIHNWVQADYYSSLRRSYSPGWGIMKGLVTSVVSAIAGGFVAVPLAIHSAHGLDKKSISAIPNVELRKYELKNRMRSYEANSKQIFSAYEDFFEEGTLSLKDACKEDICSLTPEQIAYIGHIDFLELERLNMAIRDGFKEKSMEDHIAKIRSLATDLLSVPGSYKKQMLLRGEVEVFVAELNTVRDVRTNIVAELTKKTQGLIEAMKELRKLPYSRSAAGMTEDDIAKNQLLIAKINTDLVSLDKIPVDMAALQGRIERAKGAAGRMGKFIGDMPTEESAWKKMAEEILLEVDRLGK